MHQQLITCDACKTEARDPEGWVAVRHGARYQAWNIVIEPLTPAFLKRVEPQGSKRTTAHVCCSGCLTDCIAHLMGRYWNYSKSKKAKLESVG